VHNQWYDISCATLYLQDLPKHLKETVHLVNLERN